MAAGFLTNRVTLHADLQDYLLNGLDRGVDENFN
jgi:hypothetical protein